VSPAARVLVVEDEGIISAHLQAALRRLGYHVVGTADTADDALALAASLSPDLVLMDIGLAGARDGIATAAELLATGGPPVVFLTSHADAATLARAKATEPVGYVTKPFQEVNLGATVEIGLHQSDVRRRLKASERAAREAEERLGRLAARYETLLRTGSEGIHVLDEDGKVVEASDTFAQLLGYSREEVLRLDVTAWDAQWRPEELLAKVREILDSRRIVFETRHRRKDGSILDVEVTACGVTIDGRRLNYSSARDITERKRGEQERLEMERKLLVAQKHESLGVMAAGIAHNFNNILQAVLGNVLLARDEATPAMAELLDEAARATERAAAISGMMLTYLGLGMGARAPRSLGDELEQLVPLVRPTLPANVRLELQVAPDTPVSTIDPVEFRQLVMSLVTNAWEAMSEPGGTIHISTRLLAGPEAAPPLDEDWAILEVRDDGAGMEAATLERIFDPFFSTKFTGRGLGLPAALGIVRAMGGEISATSQPGRGTTVTVRLPASVSPARAAGLPPPRSFTPVSMRAAVVQPARTPGSGRVLIVDDEATVRLASARLVRHLGYEPVFAADGAEALATFDALGREFASVLLDLSMPGLDGWAILAELRRRRPEVHVIVATGYQVASLHAERREHEPDAWLQKPYALRDLARILPSRRPAASR